MLSVKLLPASVKNLSFRVVDTFFTSFYCLFFNFRFNSRATQARHHIVNVNDMLYAWYLDCSAAYLTQQVRLTGGYIESQLCHYRSGGFARDPGVAVRRLALPALWCHSCAQRARVNCPCHCYSPFNIYSQYILLLPVVLYVINEVKTRL